MTDISEIVADKTTPDTVEIHIPNRSDVIFVGRDYADSERLLSILSKIGIKTLNSWNEKCEREHNLEMKRMGLYKE
jgi:hypothetical protein